MTKNSESLKNSAVNKIFIGFFTVSVLLVAIVSIALNSSKKSAEINNQIYQHPFSVSNDVLEVHWQIALMDSYMKDAVLAHDHVELSKAIAMVEKYDHEVALRFNSIKERFLGDKQQVSDTYMTFNHWRTIREEIISFKRMGDAQQAEILVKTNSTEHLTLLNSQISVLLDFARNKALELNKESQKSYFLSKNNFYIFTIIVILSSMVMIFFVILFFRRQKASLYENESRYEALFNNARVSIWSEDLSEVVHALEELRKLGIHDLKKHLYENLYLVWQMASKVKVNSINDATLALFEAQNQVEFIKKIQKTFGENAIEVFINELCAIWDKKTNFVSEVNFISLGGKEIQAIISFKIPTNIQDARHVPITIIDITEHKKLIRKLKLSSRVFSDTSEGIIITDANKVIVDINPAFLSITGYSYDEVIGKTPKLLSSGKHPTEFYVDMWHKITHEGYWQGEIWNRKKSGEIFAEFLNISSLKDSNNQIINYIGIFTDITQSKRQQESIHRMAHYDALTGLSNRRLLLDRFNLALAHAKRSDTLLAVCFLDLDDFKPVNDTFGHEVGDKLLIEVAHRLEVAVRSEDTVSRLGGDEFAMLLGNIQSTEQCNELLGRIIQSISAAYYIEGKPINIGASIGVSIAPPDGVELDSLLRQADQAMYLVKQEGKNSHQFFDLQREQAATLRNIKLQDLKHALNNDELCLYYQPKVNMAEGNITGVEALIRWNHPKKGLLSPIDFLPTIEGTYLEIKVGNLVIEQALKQLERLNEHDINIEMSVNVSSLQLLDKDFFIDLKASLHRHNKVDPSSFNLEIIESSTIGGDLARIREITSACRDELGVSIALDDFGTGYSSLSHLSQLPADMIKIDQSFIRNLLLDPDDFAIIDGVIGLTRSFNRNVIAEGVETEEDGVMLLLMGCNNAQGYAISKPIPSDKLVDWIRSYKPNQLWLKSSSESLNLHVIRVRQLALILKYWFKKISKTTIRKPLDNVDISHMDYCVSKWIQRLKEDHLFSPQWIENLSASYLDFKTVSVEFIESRQQKNTKLTKDTLINFELKFEKIQMVLASVSLQ